MTTAHEAMLAAATSFNDLQAYLAGKYATDLAKFGQLQSDLVDLMIQTFYVDQINGNDANVGDEANPLQTLNEATARGLIGGHVEVFLLNDYQMTYAVPVRQSALVIASIAGANPIYTLSFADQIDGVNIHQPSFRRYGGPAQINFRDLKIILVPLAAHVTVKGVIDAEGFVAVQLDGCEMEVAAGADMPLIQATGSASIYVTDTIVPVEMAGLWARNIVAGTLANDANRIIANITL